MTEGANQQLIEDFKKLKNTLKDLQQCLREIRLQHSFDALILAGLVVIVLQTFSYLFYGPILSNREKTLYMFCLLISPSAFFLLVLHLYELYGFVKRGEKSIPLTLNLTYFLFIGFAFVTMIGLSSFYDQHQISQKFLTIGWMVGVALICGEVLLALLCAKYLVSLFVSHKLPHFFDHPRKVFRKKQQFPRYNIFTPVIKPNQVYYFRKKPDISLWENEEYFIKYKPQQ